MVVLDYKLKEVRKMCKYCTNEKELNVSVSDVEATTCIISSEELDIAFLDTRNNDYLITIKINYCPMCGRQLKEE